MFSEGSNPELPGHIRLEEGAYLPQSAGEIFAGPWLVFAPHPDDETFGMGGAIALARRAGISVHVVVVTDGALGGTGIDLAARRETEVREACERLGGATLDFWREADRGLVPTGALIARARAAIDRFAGGSCFFPGLLEPHPDHRACAFLAWEALRLAGFVMQPVSYEISVQSPCNRLLDISAVVALKAAAMAAHASQSSEHPYARRVLALNAARAWSLPASVSHAEGFHVFPPADRSLVECLSDVHRIQLCGLHHGLDEGKAPVPTGAGKLGVLLVLASTVIGGAEIQTCNLLSGLLATTGVALLTHRALASVFDPLCAAHGGRLQIAYLDDYGLDDPFDYGIRNSLAYARAIADTAKRLDASVVHGVMHNASLFIAMGKWRYFRSLRGRRLSGSLHGSLIGYFRQRGAPASLAEKAVIRYTLHTLDGVVTPSAGVARELVDVFGAQPEQIKAVYNGFDLEAIRALAMEPGVPAKNAPWILTSCRLTDQKDFRTLVEGFSMFVSTPAPLLVILGAGPLAARIREWAVEFGVEDRVLLAGFQKNPFNWLRAADVFVLSSFYEGFGNVLVEAMALGVPVIASDCPWGPAEIVQHGRNGLIFPAGDAASLARSLKRCLDDPVERAGLGVGAVQRAEAFSLVAMTQAYARYFSDLQYRP